eukprot:SAG22_NODE_573_length_8999_cov_9.592921_2_plen_269_part_00
MSGGLTPEQREFYEANGYVLVPGVYSAEETAALAAAADQVSGRVAAERGEEFGSGWGGRWRDELDDTAVVEENTALLSIHDLQFHSAAFTRLLTDRRLTEPSADIVGGDIQLHHVKYHAKPPEVGTPFPMHVDYFYFPHERDTMTAYCIYLDDSTEENGCLCVYPQSHLSDPHGGNDQRWSLSQKAADGKYLHPTTHPIEAATACTGAAGSVLFFSYKTIHGSYPNRSDRIRRMLLVQLRAPDDKPLDDAHRSPGQGLMLRGENRPRL